MTNPSNQPAAADSAALLAEAQGDLDGAERLNEQVLALLRETGDMAGVADALTGLGVIARQRGDLKTARSRHQEALDAWRRAGDAGEAVVSNRTYLINRSPVPGILRE